MFSTRFPDRSIAFAAHLALLGLAACLMVIPRDAAAQTIYRCKAQGLTTFSDRPCDAVAEVYEVDTSRVSSYTPAESQQTAPPTRSAATKPFSKEKSGGSIAAAQAKQKAACEQVNSSIKELRQKMRAGYDVREGERLRERQTKLEKKRRDNRCR